MPLATVTIRFIADEHIPTDVVDFLRQRGHEVRLSRDELGLKAPDPDIASWAHAHEAVVLTADKWFRQAMQRSPPGKHVRFSKAGRILFAQGLKEPEMTARLSVHIERIEREYQYQQEQADKRLLAEITPTNSPSSLSTTLPMTLSEVADRVRPIWTHNS